MKKALVFVVCAGGLAGSARAEQVQVELSGKRYRAATSTIAAGDVLNICNRDPFFHKPFSVSPHNRFSVQLKPTECFTYTVRNPTDKSIPFKLFDDIHTYEKWSFTVSPAGGAGTTEPAAPAPTFT